MTKLLKNVGLLAPTVLALVLSGCGQSADDAKKGSDAGKPPADNVATKGDANSGNPATNSPAAKPPPAKTEKPEPKKVGYTVGAQVGQQMLRQGFQLDESDVVKGAADGLKGEDPMLPTSQFNAALQAYSDSEKKRIQANPNQGLRPPKRHPVASSPKTLVEKFSYIRGYQIGKGLAARHIKVDLESLDKGLFDVLSSAKLSMSEDEMMAVVNGLNAWLAEQAKGIGSANEKKGDSWLAANAKKKGVVALPSGLQYKVLKEGKGPKPTASSTVVCDYRGTLIDGKEFDSSYKRGQPATFPLSRVIPGWTEGLQLMSVGSKYQFFIPAKLAYGNQDQPGIPPGSALVFEVELKGIK